ncbi:MAG: hypothetical protein A2Y80_04240 [Deltaproteobacteria bacterium RBG_13_58_19]|nr:MAG: hypothetical protein A2Y80_04240 [Deltaproteobacteria bacterium RBG_13_58_19]
MEIKTWLTLAEVAYLANLNIATARDFLNRFGDLITSCEFDDVIKFPPETTGIMISIAALCREGLGTEEILEVVREIKGEPEDGSQPARSPYIKLVRAILLVVDAQNLALRQMIQVMERIALMLPEVAIFIEGLAKSGQEKPDPWPTLPPWQGS